jgi:hypothetical protein
MTREAFKQVLDAKGYSYMIEGNKIVVTYDRDRETSTISSGEHILNLRDLASLPPDVEFRNSWDVNLNGLTSLPSGVAFKNGDDVLLGSLTSLPSGVVFRNRGDIFLNSLTSLPSGVVFENRTNVYLHGVTSLSRGVVFRNGGGVYLEYLIGGYFYDWKGNIKGIDSKRLLNNMISLGLFER